MEFKLDSNLPIDNFKLRLSRGSFESSKKLATDTLHLIIKLINLKSWESARDLIFLLKDNFGKESSLNTDGPSEIIVKNLLRKVLKVIREEYTCLILGKSTVLEQTETTSLHNMVISKNQYLKGSVFGTKYYPELRERILEILDEFEIELDNSLEEISNQALQHIHANEIILTIGRSKTVEKFLKHAAKSRKFHVIIAECEPLLSGQDMAISLASSKIHCTVIADSEIFAVMSRVNKVFLGCNGIYANGGLKAFCGSKITAMAAQHYSIPLYVCSTLFKLTPILYRRDDSNFTRFSSPLVSTHNDGDLLYRFASNAPIYEYVKPELVTLFISNSGGFAPNYIYRLLSDLYSSKDYEL